MRKIIVLFLLFSLLALPVLAQTESDWLNAKSRTISAQAVYKQAQADYKADKTPINEQKLISATKDVLNAALNEVEAWLKWKNNEAKNNPDAPADIKNDIESDVNKNLAKIADFRIEVSGITTQAQAGIVFLKMAVAYLELLTDVARNTGAMWVEIGKKQISQSSNYEVKLRVAAEKISNSSEIIRILDSAKGKITEAQNNVNLAESAYKVVKLPGTPLIKFNAGNNYLRLARSNLLEANSELLFALKLLLTNK
ncbi:MAG: hypothetical protein WC460_05570 [Patescibacteria group bacterium]